MKFTTTTLVLFTFILFFSGCSRITEFIFINNTNTEVTVTYQLDSLTDKNGFFERIPSVYELNISNELDWSKSLPFIDLDASDYIVEIVLPPKSALRFGMLSNDEYIAYNQEFMNDYIFSLTKMIIESDEKSIEILPDEFDTFFKKKRNGNIEYKLK